MGMRKRIIRLIGAGLFAVLTLFGAMPALSAITPEVEDYTAHSDIAAPDPVPMQGLGSFVIYNNYLIYIANDSDIYGYDMETGNTRLVCNTAALTDQDKAIGGLFISREGYLFFHLNTTNLYRVNLASEWPRDYVLYKTSCSGNIKVITQNPWTGSIWFATVSGDNTYLYELLPDLASLRKQMVFNRPHYGTQGPLIWQGPRALLCGEQVASSSKVSTTVSYFHLLDPKYPGSNETKKIIDENYVEFPGGITGAARAWDNVIYAASGDGQAIYRLDWEKKTLVASADRPLKSLVFDGTTLYASLSALDVSRKAQGDVSFDALEKEASTQRLALSGDYESFCMGGLDPSAAYDFMAVQDRQLYYTAGDGNIYAYNLDTTSTDKLALKDSEGNPLSGVFPTGLVSTINHKLYFLDANEDPRETLYEYDFLNNTDKLTSVITGCVGIPAVLVEHPETAELYVASYEDGGERMYLSKLVAGGDIIIPTLVMDFDRFHSGENGPVIFTGSQTVLYGENTDTHGYLHKLDIKSGSVAADFLVWDNRIKGLSYGPYNSIYMIDGDGSGLYQLQNTTPISVATTLVGSAAGLCYDGNSLILSQQGFGKDPDGYGLYRVWEPPQFGILAEQECTKDDASDYADMTVSTNDGKATIGLQGGTDVAVEYLKALDDEFLESLPSHPYLPLGAVDFRLAFDDGIITGTVTVHFSQALTGGAFWWKYDAARGWYKYPNTTLSADRKSMEIMFVDGGEGDADGIQNGYILDPGGPGQASDNNGKKIYGEFTEDCFVRESRNFSAARFFSGLFLISLVSLFLLVIRLRKPVY
ncbi:MAG: hypothetical protein JEZ02_03280 [Desulfatibacillum sp.]|nr:hypothetical protein [Desulfatibacillum sp.]